MNKASRLLLPLAVTALALSGCGTGTTSTTSPSTTPTPATSTGHDHGDDDHDHDHDNSPGTGETKEVGARAPRLVMTHAGGLMVVDATTLTVITQIEQKAPEGGLLRLRESGDPRRPLLDSGTALSVIDLGSWTQKHGDHGHSKTTKPSMPGTTLTLKKAGHVSPHGDKTVVFDDGDGSVEVYDTRTLASANPTPTRTLALPPHHGNAIPLDGDKLLHTIARDGHAAGIALIDARGKTITQHTQCPGTHGSATASGGTVVIGCEDGALLVKGDTITKVKGPGGYSRMGNLKGSPQSRYVLADLKRSEDAKPTEVAIIDTEKASLRTVKLPAAYTFRGLGFTDDGHALVLTNDGKLHVIHAEDAEIEKSITLIGPFTEPEDWQKPRPTLHAQGHWAYVTDPSTKKIHGVELSVGKVMVTGTLPHAPNEITGTLG